MYNRLHSHYLSPHTVPPTITNPSPPYSHTHGHRDKYCDINTISKYVASVNGPGKPIKITEVLLHVDAHAHMHWSVMVVTRQI